MSTWDELATAEAERRDRKDSDWCALHADELFREGARWQREALLSDESVERAARAGKKDPSKEVEDLMKAQWYIAREISRVARLKEDEK